MSEELQAVGAGETLSWELPGEEVLGQGKKLETGLGICINISQRSPGEVD